MVVTVENIISNIKNDFRLTHADRRITFKYIYSLLDKHASWVMKTESDNLRLVKSDNMWQTISCVPTEEVPLTDECCKYNSKCTIVRTKEILPELYEDSWGILIKSILSSDNSTDIDIIKEQEWQRKLNSHNRKYDKTLYAFYKNKRLYLANSELKEINITGAFKEDVSKYSCESNNNYCMSILDGEWRVPQHLHGRIVDAVIKELMATFVRIDPNQEVQITKSPQ